MTSKLKLTLMNHHFEVPCPAEDQAQLIEAASLLEEKLDQVTNLRGENKVLMVALNLCYDYLSLRQDTEQYCTRLDAQLNQVITDITDTKK